MRILGIESSCDETAAAILEGPEHFESQKPSDLKLLSNVVVSQIDIFKAYGGVIPEVAARSHLEAIMPVIHQAFQDAKLTDRDGQDDWSQIDAIAVTHTPGLLGSLLVGTLTARTLAILHDKPLYAVHHLKSHIYANWLGAGSLENVFSDSTEAGKPSSSAEKSVATDFSDTCRKNIFPGFPLLALVISGGHTQILYMREHNHFEIIGTTYDDAVGECLDKAAKILGLPYPGGPALARAALGEITKADTGEVIKVSPGDRHKYQFPHPHLDNPLDFSFSGLKTAFLRTVQKIVNVPISHPSSDLKNLLSPQQIADLSASFEQAVIDILLENLQKARRVYPDVKNIVFAGGVSANALLRGKSNEISRDSTEAGKPSSNAITPVATVRRDEKAKMLAFSSSSEEQLSRETGVIDARRKNLRYFFPSVKYCGDNAAMVSAACYFEIQSGVQPTDPYSLNILPRSTIS
ncbi:MAG: tRNA (adenosine(37)-N6)-threonylcarbamoyltransferase complex transferase subunit TsaD [Candidatus Saccharibacteria bacterium]|nr:tRNA (adenosine(37)-N6)-threonylcarbamoyltransferase complex transferase subunit TsaD [Candidatus Saccharibacteria bacterium]